MTSIPTASGIYRITCTTTGRFYIGSAINLRDRWRHHSEELRHNLHHNPKLQNAWNKYGEASFIFEVLELVLIPEMLTAREQYWFTILKPFDRRGFNIDRIAGSRLGWKATPERLEIMRLAALGKRHSAEARQKMSQSQTGRKHSAETRAKMRQSSLGHSVSAESRARMSKAKSGKPPHNLGKKMPDETREQRRNARASAMKTLIVISPDGTEYLICGIRKFCEENHLCRTSLRAVTQGKQRHHKGWTARYPETDVT